MHSMTRRQFQQQLWGLGAIGFGLASNGYAQTQSTGDKWPVRAIRIISPDAAGSGNDIFARLISPLLSEALGGAAILIENKPGAGGRIGVEAAFRSAPDGHTLLVGNAGSNGINAAIYKDLPYDLEKDFVPLSLLAVGPNVLVVNAKNNDVNDLASLIRVLKSRPGEINFGITTPGSSAHLMTELFRLQSGTQFVSVSYKGAPEAARALIGGEVQANFTNLSNIMSQIQAKEVKAIAVTTATQTPLLPGVRSMAEQGMSEFDASAWTAIFAPKSTPKAITDRLQAALVSLRNNNALRERFLSQGTQMIMSDGETLGKRVSADVQRWKALVAAAKITANQ